MSYYPNLKDKQYKLKVKVNNNNDTRLWRYSDPTDFDALCAFISTSWHTKDYIAQYEDDEGDFITIASAQDLKDAYDFAVEEKKKSLKLYVRAKVATAPMKQATEASHAEAPEPEQKEEAPQFASLHEMVIDFLSNPEICRLLPEMFSVLVSNLVKKGTNLKAEEIAAMIHSQMNNEQFAVITSHPLYKQYAALAIPLVANKIALQQSLYPHFRLETIKLWIHQLMAMLSQAFKQRTSSVADIVIDIQYPATTDDGKVIHFGVECDLCAQYPIIGDRYKCSICEDWDCCTACEPKHDHPLIKFKKSRKNHENASFKGLAEIIKRLSSEHSAAQQQDTPPNDPVCDEAAAEKEEDIVVDCVCGSKMQCMEARHAYKDSNTVYCDYCSVRLYSEKMYHCPKEKDAVHHENGYDLCPKCATAKALEDKEKEMVREKEKEEEQEADKEDDDNVAADEEPQEAPQEVFEFASQLVQIKQIMALDDDSDEMIKGLLVEHKGDIGRVVPLLLDQ